MIDSSFNVLVSPILKFINFNLGKKFNNLGYKKCLQKNLPNAIIKIQDSIKSILEYKLKKKFDLIVIDNPMNIFGKN